MKNSQDAICSNCGWTDSDALGMVKCPICGSEIIPLDSEKLESKLGKQEKYPTEAVAKLEDEDSDVLPDEL